MLTFQASKQKLITLKAKELFFLAGVLGSDRLLGVEDPFKGYLAEELAEEWEQVKAALLEKGYLKQADKGKELAMPPTVFSRVAIAGLSNRACRIRYVRGGKRFEGYFHCTNERVVELVKSADEPDEYRLYDLGNVEKACETLIDKMGWVDRLVPESPALMFSKQAFNKIYEQSAGESMSQISSRLTEASGDEEGAMRLAQSLSSRVAEGELQLLVWNGREWESQRAAFVLCPAMNWIFRMSSAGNGDWLIAAMASRDQFVDLLLNWLKQSAVTEEVTEEG
ncbi:hypothetical protein FQU75_02090 [Paenibacillus polymyxa]|uniref:hypothetical protein n=1 Tax=Paenibacillus jamilae TaxID=114136 RepID=UPI0007ABC3DC|nr:hypothetical protein [Paenibacillus jamilae]KZE76840.1 hypothetical protein AV545_10660 [Paenibacillus jamilae]QDY82292.1 hypothetical protein FQU75_02090 [Paenibacillus polymyxa]